jgi:hypothetical protein
LFAVVKILQLEGLSKTKMHVSRYTEQDNDHSIEVKDSTRDILDLASRK